MSRPFHPVPFDKASVHALRSMSHGTASADQQIRALEFIVKELCETDGLSFRPSELGGSNDTAFAEGKRFVGLQLRKFIMMPLDERGEPKVANE